MKITFVQKTAPSLFTGWSEYQSGWEAELPYGEELVKQGVARPGWGKAPLSPEEVEEALPPDYTALSTPKLRAQAKKEEVWKRGMTRTQMIAALEGTR